jgi:hypothetical protein
VYWFALALSIVLAVLQIRNLAAAGSSREAWAVGVVWTLAVVVMAGLLAGARWPSPLALLEAMFGGLSNLLRGW